MKKAWTKLWDLAKKQAGSGGTYNQIGRRTFEIYKYLFLKHHQNADQIEIANDGTPLRAVYIFGDLRDGLPNKFREEHKRNEQISS